MNILGVSCYFHDAAAALLSDGVLVAAAEEERFSRKKHFGFPQQAIAFCLRVGRVQPQDLDYVVFFEKPFVKFERLLISALQSFPRSHRLFREAMVGWLGDKLWIKQLIRNRVGVTPDRILFSEHHLSHAASAFFCSPFEDAAILTIDGVGEWTTASYGVGRGNNVRLLGEIVFPHSLGLLYSAFTAFLGFEVNEGEYKVMGMAPFGRPRYTDKVEKLIRVARDGSFELDLDYFSFHYSPEHAYSAKFLELFGPPRDPDSHFFTCSSGYPPYFGERSADFHQQAESNQYYADVAASIQAVTEDVLLTMAAHIHQQTGLKRLCIAGGVGLNSTANGRLLRDSPFEEIYVQPAAGDSGAALGAALYGWHMVLGRPRSFVMRHAYWGEEHSPGEIEAFLKANGIAYRRFDDESELIGAVVDGLARGKVTGWVQGRFEWGPRALGNRSILADPRRPEMKDLVNVKIKFREPFRPFAPTVLAAHASDYFDLPPGGAHTAAFMLAVTPVRQARQQQVPATTHVDGSARVQVLEQDTNPRYAALIEAFGQATGVPVVLNTSFNLRGEPIVNTPAEAYRTFCNSGMDVLVLGDCLVEKRGEIVE